MNARRRKLLPAAFALFLLGAQEGNAGDASPLFDGAGEKKSGSLSEFVTRQEGSVPDTGSLIGLDDRFWVTIKAGNASERTRIATIGMSIEEIDGGLVRGVASQEIIELLAREGLTIADKTPLYKMRPEDFPEQDGAYHNYGEAQSALADLAAAHPDIVSLFPIGKSVEGRDITAVRFHMKSDDGKTKPGIAFLGAHHAREHLSTEIPLLLAQWLGDNRETPEVRRLLETRDVYVIPMINPDGVEYDIATGRYRWQRKNMRKNGNGTVGVDLNRNYDFRWGGEGASGNPGASTYRGPSAFSEPESQAVRDFLTSHKNIRIVVSYHTFSELILYPWGGLREPLSDGRALGAFKAMADTMAGWTGYRPMQSSGLYVATGDTCDWAWNELKMFCFTFELTPKSRWGGGFYPGAGAIATTFKKNIDPALYLIDLADDPYRAGGAGDS